MSDDGRLLVLLGLLGVAGVGVARGSRGVVRRGRPHPSPPHPGSYTLRIWLEEEDGASDEFYDSILDLLPDIGILNGPSVDDAGMWWMDFETMSDDEDDEDALIRGFEAALENFVSSRRDQIKDWTLEPT